MKKQVILKRVFTLDGVQRTEMKVVEVDIPEIPENEGWNIVSSADSVEIVTSVPTKTKKTSKKDKVEVKKTPAKMGDKFESLVSGTAKLVRLKDKIFIAYRKGKITYNQTTPNSVCISDSIKDEFFRSVNKYGQSPDYEFTREHDKLSYEAWSKFMDNEYARQLGEYNKSIAK